MYVCKELFRAEKWSANGYIGVEYLDTILSESCTIYVFSCWSVSQSDVLEYISLNTYLGVTIHKQYMPKIYYIL
jgi:hypothetical protein